MESPLWFDYRSFPPGPTFSLLPPAQVCIGSRLRGWMNWLISGCSHLTYKLPANRKWAPADKGSELVWARTFLTSFLFVADFMGGGIPKHCPSPAVSSDPGQFPVHIYGFQSFQPQWWQTETWTSETKWRQLGRWEEGFGWDLVSSLMWYSQWRMSLHYTFTTEIRCCQSNICLSI